MKSSYTCQKCGKLLKPNRLLRLIEKISGKKIVLVCKNCYGILPRIDLDPLENHKILKLKDWKLISAKRISNCEICKENFPVGEKIYWSPKGGVICCTADYENVLVKKIEEYEIGHAGQSAQEKYLQKLQHWENQNIANLGPFLGRMLSLWRDEPKEISNWYKGAIGEKNIGKTLNALCSTNGFKVLHDRKIKGTSSNIDHILVTDRGVFVIDAKNYSGIVRIHEEGGFSSPYFETLYVKGRKQTKLINGVKYQIELVHEALEKYRCKIPVFGILDFYNADWQYFFKPRDFQGVLISNEGTTGIVLNKPVLENVDVIQVFNILAGAFPPKR